MQPVRKPGSMAITICFGIGGWSSRLRRFLAKTSTACFSAPVGQIAPDLALHAGKDESVQRIERGGAEELGVRMAFERKLSEERGFDFRPRQIEPDLERAFLVAPVDGENSMRRDLSDGLGIVEIIAVLEALPFGNLGLGGDDPAGFPDEPANRVAARPPSR